MRHIFFLECPSSKAQWIQFQKKYSISNTGDLAKLLVLKANARVLIITNIDVSGRLINEQAGIFKHIETKEKIE